MHSLMSLICISCFKFVNLTAVAVPTPHNHIHTPQFDMADRQLFLLVRTVSLRSNNYYRGVTYNPCSSKVKCLCALWCPLDTRRHFGDARLRQLKARSLTHRVSMVYQKCAYLENNGVNIALKILAYRLFAFTHRLDWRTYNAIDMTTRATGITMRQWKQHFIMLSLRHWPNPPFMAIHISM